MNFTPEGLSSAQAAELLAKWGRNEIPLEQTRPLLAFLRKFWGPIPWMLEAVIAMTLATGRFPDAIGISFLLVFNATLARMQEARAANAVALLRKAIVVQAQVYRDGAWRSLAAAELVPGDTIHLDIGNIVPADMRVVAGTLEVDESTITGESLPREVAKDGVIYASGLVKRGQADGIVVATGLKTTYGKTAELVRTAKSNSTLERLVMQLVRILSFVSIAIVAIVILDAIRLHIDLVDVALFGIILLLASVPVAFPVAFTIATTLGSLELARKGVLVTRLSAIEDAASMSILFTDKTGTITKNEIVVASVLPFGPHSDADVLDLAWAASDPSSQDPIDAAVGAQIAATHGSTTALAVHDFTPFDPATKRSSASISWNGESVVVYKGAPGTIKSLCKNSPSDFDSSLTNLANQGYRVIAVAFGAGDAVECVGLIALADPPRDDAKALVSEIDALGVRMKMLTGDSIETARSVAQSVGIKGDACSHDGLVSDPSNIERCSIFASIYPDDKLSIVRSAQHAGHIVGMTGDGVNDAPALKQANIGIAVSSATDVAKASASVILTEPGLANILPAIDISRRIFQRMLTYTLMKIIKYFEITLLLSIAFFLTGRFLLTAELMVVLLVLNDFVTLAIATDHVGPVHGIESWHVWRLVFAVLPIAALTAVTVLAIVLFSSRRENLD
ncbi:MAG: HAD-IC family P-type ATPase, partial [Vulcanimicrobiaceae bacterium]